MLVSASVGRPAQGEGKHGDFILSHGHSHFENQVDCGELEANHCWKRVTVPLRVISIPRSRYVLSHSNDVTLNIAATGA